MATPIEIFDTKAKYNMWLEEIPKYQKDGILEMMNEYGSQFERVVTLPPDLLQLKELFDKHNIPNTSPDEHTLDCYMDEVLFRHREGKLHILGYGRP